MKKTLLVAFVAMTLTAMAQEDDYSAQYVVQYNEESQHLILYSREAALWHVYSLNTECFCPTCCEAAELLYSDRVRSNCMEWSYRELRYPENYERYWGDYYNDHTLYIINNNKYGIVSNYVKSQTMCPTMCGSNRLAGNITENSFAVVQYGQYAFRTTISSSENLSLRIYDCTGRIVYSVPEVSGKNIVIPYKPEAGIYFIELKSISLREMLKAVID